MDCSKKVTGQQLHHTQRLFHTTSNNCLARPRDIHGWPACVDISRPSVRCSGRKKAPKGQSTSMGLKASSWTCTCTCPCYNSYICYNCTHAARAKLRCDPKLSFIVIIYANVQNVCYVDMPDTCDDRRLPRLHVTQPSSPFLSS